MDMWGQGEQQPAPLNHSLPENHPQAYACTWESRAATTSGLGVSEQGQQSHSRTPQARPQIHMHRKAGQRTWAQVVGEVQPDTTPSGFH